MGVDLKFWKSRSPPCDLLHGTGTRRAFLHQKEGGSDIYAMKVSSSGETLGNQVAYSAALQGTFQIRTWHVFFTVCFFTAIFGVVLCYHWMHIHDLEKRNAEFVTELETLRLSVASLCTNGVKGTHQFEEVDASSTMAGRLKRSPRTARHYGERSHNESFRPRKYTPMFHRLAETTGVQFQPNFLHIDMWKRNNIIGPWETMSNSTLVATHNDDSSFKILTGGFYLIYAQVESFIHYADSMTDRPSTATNPPRFELIAQQKHAFSAEREMTTKKIAECIPTYQRPGSRTSQTCFTMSSTHLEAGDVLYLTSPENSDAHVTVYAHDKAVRTYVGFIKLGGMSL